MSESRWADELMPDQPEWVRSLVDDELDRRDKRIAALEKAHRANISEYHERGGMWPQIAAATMCDNSRSALKKGED